MKPATSGATVGGTAVSAVYWQTNDPKSLWTGDYRIVKDIAYREGLSSLKPGIPTSLHSLETLVPLQTLLVLFMPALASASFAAHDCFRFKILGAPFSIKFTNLLLIRGMTAWAQVASGQIFCLVYIMMLPTYSAGDAVVLESDPSEIYTAVQTVPPNNPPVKNRNTGTLQQTKPNQ